MNVSKASFTKPNRFVISLTSGILVAGVSVFVLSTSWAASKKEKPSVQTAVPIKTVNKNGLLAPANTPTPTPAEPTAQEITVYDEAIGKAKSALAELVKANTDAQTDADGIKEALKTFTVDDDMVLRLSTAVNIVNAGIIKKGRFKPLTDKFDALKAARTVLDGKYQVFAPWEREKNSTVPDAVKERLANYKSFNKDADAQLNEAKDAAKAKEPLKKSVEQVSTVAFAIIQAPPKAGEPSGLIELAKSAANFPDVMPENQLRSKLPGVLLQLKTSLHLRRILPPVTTAVYNALQPTGDLANITPNPTPKFDVAYGLLDGYLKSATSKIPVWSDQVSTLATRELLVSQRALEDYVRDPYRNLVATMAQVPLTAKAQKDIGAVAANLQEINEEAQLFSASDAVLVLYPTYATSIPSYTVTFQSIATSVAQIGVTIKLLQSDAPADKTSWNAEQINLYYFDDVPRLIQVLSPNAREMHSNDFKKEAQNKRKELIEASQALEALNQRISDGRQAVADIEEELRQAQLNVDKASKQSRQQVEVADLAAVRASEQARNMEARRKRVTGEQVVAKARYDRALAASQAKPTDTVLQERLEETIRELEAVELRQATAQADEDKAKQEAQTANERLGKLTSAAKPDESITQRLTDAKSALNRALEERQNATNEQRSAVGKAFLAAQAENFAFAYARDNSSFWTNVPENVTKPSSLTTIAATATDVPHFPESDPVNRVMLFGFPDSKTLFIRGCQQDIDMVREMVMSLDRPRGQSLMTLWTMEISSDGTKEGSEEAFKALRMIDRELDQSRVATNTAIGLLRDSVAQVVRDAVREFREDVEASRDRTTKDSVRITKRPKARAQVVDDVKAALSTLRSSAITSKGRRDALAVIAAAGFDEYANALLKEGDPLTRAVAFYDEDVMKQLGWTKKSWDMRSQLRYLRAVVPDPEQTSTVAQALVVLSLAKQEYRMAAVNLFLTQLASSPDAKVTCCGTESKDKDKKFGKTPVEAKALSQFKNFRQFMKVNRKEDEPNSGIKSFQREIIGVLLRNAAPAIMEYVKREADELNVLQKQVDEAVLQVDIKTEEFEQVKHELLQLDTTLSDGAGGISTARLRLVVVPEVKNLANRYFQLATRKDALIKVRQRLENQRDVRQNKGNIATALNWLQQSSIDPGFLQGMEPIKDIQSMGIDQLISSARGLRRGASARYANAREAAANETFKKFLRALDDDIQQEFVQPMFNCIRAKLLKSKLGLGVLQRTSILASNRLVAKVDPRGSAQLAVGQEQNVLEAAKQLANILGVAGAGAVTGAANPQAALLGGPSASAGAVALKSAQNVIGAIDEMPRDAAPGVYGINTGNVFEVTPIPDPSGQALRLRFDLLATTQVREPNDTIDPQLPRIERHSINTEVQLSNHEIRLVSQFQANSRLGIGKRKSGGIPILKDLPVVKNIPLIGWFVKRGGQASQVQQSLIFAETAMLPTVGEVVDLMPRPINGDNTEESTPEETLDETSTGNAIESSEGKAG